MSACSLQIILSLSSSSLPNGGKVEREIRLHEEHSSQASTPTRLRQFIALASSSAKSFLPIPASPVKSSDPGTRPETSKRRSDSLTWSLPMRRENINQYAVVSKQRTRNPNTILPRLARDLSTTASRYSSLPCVFPGPNRGRR